MPSYQRYGLRHRYAGYELDNAALRRLFWWGVFLAVFIWLLWPNR